MVDLVAIQAQAKGVSPIISCEGDQCLAFARASQEVDTLPPPYIDGVDMLYRQLEEILAIATTQPAECARRRRAGDSTSSLVRSRAD
jgi:hypothetical protein